MDNKEESKKRPKFSRLCLSQIKNATVRTNTQSPNSQISRFFSHSNTSDDTSKPENSTAKVNEVATKLDMNNCDKTQRYKDEKRTKESLKTDAATVKQCDRKKTKSALKSVSSDSKSTIKSFFSNDDNDSMDDFEIPSKVMKRAPKIQPPKTTKSSKSRRKLPDIRKALSKRDDASQDYSHLPEDAQLALALAMSKAESNAKAAADDESNEPFDLESYEFRPKNAKGNGDFCEFFSMPKKTNARFKWNSKCTQLTRRKDHVQTTKIREKVDELLLNNIIVESGQTNRSSLPEYFTLPDYTSSEIYSKYLQRICISERILFESNSREEHSSSNILSYYTNNLVEKSDLSAGVLLRDWSKIPGRDAIYDGIQSSLNETDKTDATTNSSQLRTIADDYDAEVLNENTPMDIPTEEQSHEKFDIEQEMDLFHEEEVQQDDNQTENSIQNDDTSSDDNDVDATVMMDSDDIQLKVDAINSKIRLSQKFSDIFEPAVVKYESTSTVRTPSPDLFADDDDIDIVMTEEIQGNSEKSSSNMPADEDTVEAAASSEVIEISSNECKSNPVSSIHTQNIDSEETLINDEIMETIDLLDSDSESEKPIDSLSNDNVNATCVASQLQIIDGEYAFMKPDENTSGIQNSSTKSNGSLVKKLSFTERLELYERDMMNGFTDDLPEECFSQNYGQQSKELSQESIVLSDDEINYSMNKGGAHAVDDNFEPEEDYYNRYMPSPIEFNLIESNSTSNCDSDDLLVNQSVCNIFEKTFEHSNSPVPATTKRKTIGAKSLKKINSDVGLTCRYENDTASTSAGNTNRLKTPDKKYKMIDFDSPKKQFNSPASRPMTEIRMDLSNEEYHIRVGSVTPKPNYESMDTTTLEMELRKFGLKPSLRRRQAIICLDYIYNRTHPFMEIGNENVECSKHMNRDKEPRSISNDTETNDPKINFNIGFATHNLVDEKFKQKNVANIFLPSALRAKKPWCIVPLHIAWHNLIKANHELRKAVLLYEPINLIELKKFFKTIDMTFDNRDLISFFDLHCITFRMIKATKE